MSHRFGRLGGIAVAASLVLAVLGKPAAGEPAEDPFFGALPEAENPPELATIPLAHTDAADAAERVRSELGLLSENGTISADPRTNTLILYDTPEHIARTRELLQGLDHPRRQVMIETRIVLATGDYARELGTRLELTAERGSGNVTLRSLSAEEDADDEGGDPLMAELPAVGPASGLGVSVGEVGEQLLQFELLAMEAEGHGRIVSTPRVMTSEREEARIEQGVQIPYQETAESGATAVAFEDAALSLTVTPEVTDDDAVILDLKVTKDAVGAVYDGVPSIETQSLTTQLRVGADETVVLGGVQEQEQHEQQSRTPWLAELPLLGWLFRSTTQQSRQHELLVFVTPRLADLPPPVDAGATDPQIDPLPGAAEVEP